MHYKCNQEIIEKLKQLEFRTNINKTEERLLIFSIFFNFLVVIFFI